MRATLLLLLTMVPCLFAQGGANRRPAVPTDSIDSSIGASDELPLRAPLRAQELGRQGAASLAKGDLKAAESRELEAIAMLEKSGPGSSSMLAASLDLLGIVYRQSGQWQKALSVLSRAEHLYGAERRDLGLVSILTDLAAVLYLRHSYREADSTLERAKSEWEACCSENAAALARISNNMASVRTATGRYEEAAPLYARAIALYEQAVGPDGPALAVALNNFAAFQSARGDRVSAEGLYRRAIAIWRRSGPPAHPDYSKTLGNYAGLLAKLGRYDEADRYDREALAVRRSCCGEESLQYAGLLAAHASVLRKLNRKEDAKSSAAESAAIFQRLSPADTNSFTVNVEDLRRDTFH